MLRPYKITGFILFSFLRVAGCFQAVAQRGTESEIVATPHRPNTRYPITPAMRSAVTPPPVNPFWRGSGGRSRPSDWGFGGWPPRVGHRRFVPTQQERRNIAFRQRSNSPGM